MSKTNNNKLGMIDFLVNHSKKIMITLIAFVVILSLGVGTSVWMLSGNKVAASYGDKKVLKSDYEDFKSKCEGFYSYNSDNNAKKECSQGELEDLILRKALETEAEARGITVSDADINKKYKTLAEPYGSEAAYQQVIKSSFGYTPEYVKSNIKRDILKEKLAPYLLKKVSVSGVVVRYDWAGEVKDYDKTAEQSKEKLEKEFLPLLKNGSNDKDIQNKINEVAKRDGRPWDVEPVLAYVSFDNLNPETAKDTFAGKEDWEGISKLQSKGDVTAIIKSTGGYMVAYRLENTTTGQYSTWDSYKQSVLKKAKTYSFEYNYKALKKSVASKVSNGLADAKKMIGLNTATAAVPPPPITCSGQHFSRMNGYIVDASNTSHGIVANVSIAPGTIGTWPACRNPQEGGAITVQSNYMNLDGVNYNNAGLLQLGWQNDVSRKYLSCWVRWNVSISARGFYGVQYINRSVTANGVTTYLDKPLGYGGKTGEGYSGYYQEENTNNNAVIYLAPIMYNLKVNKSGSGSGVVNGAGNYNFGTTATVTASADAGSTFKGWEGSGCSGKGECKIYMDGNKEVTAIFDKDDSHLCTPGVDCPPDEDRKCSLATVPASVTQVKQGDTVNLGWMVKDADAPISLKQSSGSPISLSNIGSGSGTINVLPLVTTTYTLIDKDGKTIKDHGNACSVTVKVLPGMSGGANQVAP